jgi:hypothetical protein
MIAQTGDSDEMRVGEQVVAIGNALGYGQSVTTGIISAKDRMIQVQEGMDVYTYENLIQTDAAINPGNSGGALLNMNGEVIVLDSINFDGQQSGEAEEAGGEVTPQVRFESDEGNALYMEYDESNEIYNVYLEFSGESFEGNAYYADGRMDIDGTDPNGDPIYMQAISNGENLVLTVTESSWDGAPAGSQYVMKAYLEA